MLNEEKNKKTEDIKLHQDNKMKLKIKHFRNFFIQEYKRLSGIISMDDKIRSNKIAKNLVTQFEDSIKGDVEIHLEVFASKLLLIRYKSMKRKRLGNLDPMFQFLFTNDRLYDFLEMVQKIDINNNIIETNLQLEERYKTEIQSAFLVAI